MEIKIIMGNFKMKGTLETREVKRGHIKPKVETMLQPKQGTTDRSINRIFISSENFSHGCSFPCWGLQYLLKINCVSEITKVSPTELCY